jgi:hypothetical protein
MSAPTYTAAKSERLIRAKSVSGEYHVTGSLNLSGAKNPDPTQWWSENGETTKRRCIAISDYALIQTDTDRFFAGCRKNLTHEQALAHWGAPRRDKRAVAFRKAIKEAVL